MPDQPEDGPCFTCIHAVSRITHGECLKYNGRKVVALGGCLDYGTTVYYEFNKALIRPKRSAACPTDPTQTTDSVT